MHNEVLKREVIIGAALFAFGFFVLPLAIYWVGRELIGEYAPDAGVWTLMESIWADLLSFRLAAWLIRREGSSTPALPLDGQGGRKQG